MKKIFFGIISLCFLAGPVGAASNESTFSTPRGFHTNVPYPAAPFITPQQYGAVCNGDAANATADTSGLTAAIAAALANNYQTISTGGTCALTGAVDISNFTTAINIHLGGVIAGASFPSPSTWQTATPFFTIGTAGGSQVGINLSIDYVNGSSKADVIHVVNDGAGGSTFNLGYVTTVNGGVKWTSNTQPASSDRVTGNYWTNGQFGLAVGGGSAPAEGEIIDVGFITGFNYGGILLYDGSHFNNIRSQLDFNGQWLSQMAVASNSGWAIGNTITDTTHSGVTGTVQAVYTSQGTQYILAIETKNVSGGHSNFTSGDAISNGTSSTTISAITTANQSSSEFYFDIISAHVSDPFARDTIIAPYLGGIVGSLLYTDFIQSGNANNSATNSNQGLQITNAGNGQIDLYNTYLSSGTPFLDVTSTLFSPTNRDIYIPSRGISNGNIGVTSVSGTPVTIFTLTTPTSQPAQYLIETSATDNAPVSGLAFVTIDISGNVNLNSLAASNLTFSVSGKNIQILQGAGTFAMVTNTLKLTLSQ